MPWNVRARAQSEDGFTLIELLIVIIVLGILIALAVPSYLSRRVQAQDTVAKTDARSMQRFVEACATSNGGYIGVCEDQPTLETFNDGPTRLPYGWGPGEVEVDPCTEPNPPNIVCAEGVEGYFINAKSRSGTTFWIRKVVPDDGELQYRCSSPGIGGCRADGTW
jgi:prepilin-type N-terminal cleavage/methylation domain-containing protein